MSFFCSEGFSFKWENVIFAAYFILRGRDMHIDFLRLLFLVGVICPGDLSSDARTFIAAKKKPHQSSARRPVYKRLFKSNRVLHADQKSDVNQTCQQSVFSPMGACISIWFTSGAVERRSQMFVYVQALTLSLLSPRDFFHPFPEQRASSKAITDPKHVFQYSPWFVAYIVSCFSINF